MTRAGAGARKTRRRERGRREQGAEGPTGLSLGFSGVWNAQKRIGEGVSKTVTLGSQIQPHSLAWLTLALSPGSQPILLTLACLLGSLGGFEGSRGPECLPPQSQWHCPAPPGPAVSGCPALFTPDGEKMLLALNIGAGPRWVSCRPNSRAVGSGEQTWQQLLVSTSCCFAELALLPTPGDEK